MREALARTGRAGEFRIAKRVYVAVDSDAGRARDKMNRALERLYGRRSPDIEAAAIAGRRPTASAPCIRSPTPARN